MESVYMERFSRIGFSIMITLFLFSSFIPLCPRTVAFHEEALGLTATNGRIFVFVSYLDTFLMFDTNGRYLKTTESVPILSAPYGGLVANDSYIYGGNSIYGVGSTVSKFNLEGDLIWAESWNLSSGCYADLAVDGEYIYAVGARYPTPDTAANLVKYDHLGNIIWNRSWAPPSTAYAECVGTDSNHSIYMGGRNNNQIFLVKYDSAGNLLMTEWWDPTIPFHIIGMVLDDSDNVYLVGSYGYSRGKPSLLKYNSSGYFQWNKTLPFPEVTTDILVLQNHIFLTGGGSLDLLNPPSHLLKYDFNGTLIWTMEWLFRYYWHISTDGSFIYLSGSQHFPHTVLPGQDLLITKCSPDGLELWSSFYWSEQPNIFVITAIFGGIGITAFIIFHRERLASIKKE